ncbi:TolC family outer membrane protein [Chelativorans sp. ZYF759]|uniref:TolC family outer membrane protein n=1 Tax=Chelativorans sp. ZYF759 TaxID=2692213 RepID=UPI00145E17DA|nr:TolC family outer membrane protein [Chelativorans sp. ZYF759]NMG38667.1 TolC family outer membrane protein [Chelativorans sp. ZYF759]
MSVLNRVFPAALLATSLLFSGPAMAETLTGALAKAYQNNSQLNAARAGVRVTNEGVPLAKSGYRPQIVGSGSASVTEQAGTQISTGQFGVQIQQSIFDGFQTQNNVRAAEARVRASNESLRNTEQNVLFNAAAAFMDVIRDRRIAAFRQRNLEFLAEQVRAAESRFEVGEGTRTDTAQAQASRSAAEAQLSAARAQVQVSEATYRQLVGENPGQLQAASPATSLLPRSMEDAFVIALREHPAIVATQHLVDVASFAVKAAEGALLPQVSAQASVQSQIRRAPAAGLPGVSVGGYETTTTNSATIGLNLTVPIYSGGQTSARVRQSKESLGEARIEVDVSRDQVRQAVASAWTQFVAAREVAAANRQLVSAAELALSGVTEERNVGQRTTLDVLNAQADVINAQINLASSERDQVVASYAILSAIGALSVRRLGLPVNEHRPQEHYDAVKDLWIGTSTPDGR